MAEPVRLTARVFGESVDDLCKALSQIQELLRESEDDRTRRMDTWLGAGKWRVHMVYTNKDAKDEV